MQNLLKEIYGTKKDSLESFFYRLFFLVYLSFNKLYNFGNGEYQRADNQREEIFPNVNGHKREQALQEGNEYNQRCKNKACRHRKPKHLVVSGDCKNALFT